MEWSEFTQFIIDSVMQQKTDLTEQVEKLTRKAEHHFKKTYGDVVRKAKRTKLDYMEVLKKEQVVLSKNEFKKFYPSSEYLDKTTHRSIIKKAIFVEDFDSFLTLESYAFDLKLFTKYGEELCSVPLKT